MADQSLDAADLRERQRQVWDLAAPSWGRQHNQSSATESRLTEQLIDLAGVASGHRVLDLACGVGDPAFAIAARVGSVGSVLGLDLSRGMIEQAQRGAIARGLANVEFRAIESESDLGIMDGGFDAATCRFGLMFMPDPGHAAMLIRRALKPGARFAVCTWAPPDRVPYFGLIAAIVRRHVDLPPPDPNAPGPLRLSTPEVLTDIFRAGGFVDLKIATVETTVLDTDGPEAFWDTAVTINGLLLAVLPSLPVEQRDEIRDDAIRTLREKFPEGPVRLGGEALLASGVNPG